MLKIYCLVFVLFFVSQICPQWVQTGGPTGGYVECFAVVPDGAGGTYIFAGTGKGIYISTNNGEKWVYRNAGLPEYSIYALAVCGTNIFAGTYGNYGAYRSTNNGESWSPASTGLPQYYAVNAFAVCDSNIFAAVSEAVYLSTNNGMNWTRTGSGLPANCYINHISASGKNIFATIIENNNFGVYRSTDNGKSWSAADSGLPKNTGVNKFVVSGTNILAAVYESGVFLSTDNGDSWSAVNSGLPQDSLGHIYLHELAVNGTNVYASLEDGFFLSNDNGVHWKKISQDFPWLHYVRDLAIVGTSMISAAGGGIYRSSDGGVNWIEANSGFINTDIKAIAVNGSNVFAGGIPGDWRGRVYHSADNGENWTIDSLEFQDTTYILYPFIKDFAVSGTNTFAGGYLAVYEGWFRRTFLSVHNGKDWTDISSGLPENSSVEALAVSGKNLFAAIQTNQENTVIFISTDNGKNWQNRDPMMPFINDLAVKGSNIFAATKNGVYVSSDTCKSWTKVSSGLPKGDYEEILALAVCDSFLFASPKGERVFLSIDNGANWYPNRAVLSGINCFVVRGKDIFAAGGNRILMSSDYCMTAVEMNAGLSKDYENFDINSLALSETEIFAATSRGVWRRPLSDMTTSTERHSFDIPAQFELEQNYPNPFNSNTIIKYSIPQSGFVTLKIFDILGEEILTLVKEEQPAGIYTVKFNGSYLASGIYMYQLRAGSRSTAKKFVLLK